VFICGLLLLAGCQTAPKTQSDRDVLHAEALATISMFAARDPGLKILMDQAAGYAVFPSVGKGAIGVGGAYGRGEVFVGGRAVGYCDLSQGSVGFQLGGQSYRELILFQTPEALENFKSGAMQLAAQASAVAATSGASADADYHQGVMVFTMARGGLMYEASVGGQHFTYVPK
jgi:lipid-binding SYLF domain-containing protein